MSKRLDADIGKDEAMGRDVVMGKNAAIGTWNVDTGYGDGRQRQDYR